MIELLGNVALVGSVLGFLVFVLRYGFLSPWWETAVGQNLMAFMSVCMVLLSLSVFRLIVGDAWFNAHRDGLRLFSFSLVFVVVWWRVFLLLKAQRRGRRNQA